MTAEYAKWAESWAAGMARSESYRDANRAAQSAVAVANRAAGAQKRCAIKGCARHAYKGRICRKHWQLVPRDSKVALSVDCIVAQRKTAERHYKKIERELRAALK